LPIPELLSGANDLLFERMDGGRTEEFGRGCADMTVFHGIGDAFQDGAAEDWRDDIEAKGSHNTSIQNAFII
jgi:hypothetical protein